MRRLVSRRNIFWLLLIASLAFNVGFGGMFGVRTYRHYCSGRGDGASLPDLSANLNLTPEQRVEMSAAKEKLLQQVADLTRELTSRRETLAALLAAPETDRPAIVKQLDEIALLQRQIQQRMVEHLLEEKGLLTLEQQEAFNEIIRRRVCPRGNHGPESVPGHDGLLGEPKHEDADECVGEEGP